MPIISSNQKYRHQIHLKKYNVEFYAFLREIFKISNFIKSKTTEQKFQQTKTFWKIKSFRLKNAEFSGLILPNLANF